jgi:heme A synthase
MITLTFFIQIFIALVFLCAAVNIFSKEKRKPQFDEWVIVVLLVFLIINGFIGACI